MSSSADLRPARASDAERERAAPLRFERAADEVFEHLRGAAITCDGLAVWVSPPTEQRSRPGGVGPTLYGGTAGIALALAQYADLRSQGWAMDLAQQAAAHALAHAAGVPTEHRFGLYGGWAGIVYATSAVAARAGDPSLLRGAASLVEQLARTDPSSQFDLVSGQAGAVAGLALAAPEIGERSVQLAAQCARRLQESAVALHRAVAWRSPGEGRQLPLTGFAHGTSGVSWALLELAAAAPGVADLTDLAEASFRYEDARYDEAGRNWPDLRHYSTWATTRVLPPPQQVAWCHGAGGIALARFRAAELTGRSAHLRTGAAAARTVAGDAASLATRATTSGAGGTRGLCHGLAGHRFVLAEAARVTGDTGFLTALRGVDEAVGAAAAQDPDPDPGLMLGSAGVGLTLLAAAGCATQPALRPGVITGPERG